MDRLNAMRRTLLTLAIDTAAQSGLDAVSLRHIAKQAGCSTAVIFQNFEGKADLLQAALDQAIKLDAGFHRSLLADVSGLITGHIAFADFLSAYVELRAVTRHARFLSEMLVTRNDSDSSQAALRQWHQDRTAFWHEVLAPFAFADRLAPIVAEYALMEEIYAYSMIGQPRFHLLMREAARALTDACFNDGKASGAISGINAEVGGQVRAARGKPDPQGPSMPEQMLGHAIQLIKEHGIGGLNQRMLARKAGVSSSMISYHFKDMKSFTNQAVWRALVEEIPSEFDPQGGAVQFPDSVGEWLNFLNSMLAVEPGKGSVGFYVSFSRMAGEASLLARSDKSLVPLMVYLREIDGWGTYRLSRNIPAMADRVQRQHAAAFAVWIKAEAILRYSGLVDPADGRSRLDEAIAIIFPLADEHS